MQATRAVVKSFFSAELRSQVRGISRSVPSLHVVHINETPGEKEKVISLELQAKAGERVALCRCWKSAKFPYCDGAHNALNKTTGDSVGPVIVTVVAAE